MSSSTDGHNVDRIRLGATCAAETTTFLVWAPHASQVEVHLVGEATDRLLPMRPLERGYYGVAAPDVHPGQQYFYRLNGAIERPDPASYFQPHGVHAASQVVDRSFPWTDAQWRGPRLEDYVIYELHVGTFTPGGKFQDVIEQLDALVDLGVTAIELMPVAQFPGGRNWGYDGVHPFAPQDTYGGPAGMKALIDAAHGRGLAVILDVVYNHLGPEGNYLAEFGPYFTDRHLTPWGAALNFDAPHADEVRRFFTENALYWVTEFHVDALRLDAVHAIFDGSARPFLRELASAVRARGRLLGRNVYTIAESNLNDPRLVDPPEAGGYGLDAQWLDDFQRALHAALTGERQGAYSDFGAVAHVAQALDEGFVLDGRYSHYRRRQYGTSSRHLTGTQLVAFSQNHDQVGNRSGGERLAQLVDFESLKLAAAVVILGPYIPLLFMGEEYAERTPFHYFVSHLDPQLISAVAAGRRRDLATFQEQRLIHEPQAENTFLSSKLDHGLRAQGTHAVLWGFYRELLAMRRELGGAAGSSKSGRAVRLIDDDTVVLRRANDRHEALIVYHFGLAEKKLELDEIAHGQWKLRLDSADARWSGPLSGGDAAHRPLAPRSTRVWVAFA